MTRDEVISRIKPLEARLRSSGIAALYLFGSTARNEASVFSDVDFACDLDMSRPLSLLDLAGMQLELQDHLPAHVDLVVREAMRPRIRARAEVDMFRVF